jgi:hypothetical protein
MEHFIKHLAHIWHLSPAQYWQLRLLVAISLAPLMGVLYVILVDRTWGTSLPKHLRLRLWQKPAKGVV